MDSKIQELKSEMENGNIAYKNLAPQVALDIITAAADMSAKELNEYADEMAKQSGVTSSQACTAIRMTIASAMIVLEKLAK